MTRVVLASRNAHKLEEFRRILGGAVPGLELVGDDGPEPVEDGVTFAENALLKARAAARRTGLPALADDSGLCVDVLGGAPGIFSARWCGRHGDAAANNALLLAQLADVREADRAAHFACTIALVRPDGEETVVEGGWPGRVATEERGSGGFGYDPLFLPAGSDRSAAELSADEKNAVSHRARAFEAILPALRELVASGGPG